MHLRSNRQFLVPGRLPPGTQLGEELTLLGVLGEGGTGVVYRARHAVLKREVAVKMCHSLGPGSPELRERLILEAKMCASVRNPHIPRIYALDLLPDGTPFVIMEKVEGEPLSSLLARGRLPPRVACDLGSELLRALEAVHRARVIHRDVKPSNLIINLQANGAPRLRLLDFGIGKVISDAQREAPELTRPGTVLGTPTYMAPEQMTEGAIGPLVDLYAAGVVLYEMLAGRPPFRAPSVAETFAAVLHDQAPRLEQICPELPPTLGELVHKAFSRTADDRFATAHEMRVALDTVSASLPLLAESVAEAFVIQRQHDEHCSTLVWDRDAAFHHDAGRKSNVRRLPTSVARTLRASRRLNGSANGPRSPNPNHPMGFLAPRPVRRVALAGGLNKLAANS